MTVFRVLIFRRLFAVFARKQFFRRKVLIVGTDRTAQRIAVQLKMDDGYGFEVAGFVDDELKKNRRIFEDLRVLGDSNELKNLVEKYQIEEIIIAQSEITHRKLLEIIDKAKLTSASVRLASELYSIVFGKVFVEKYLGVPAILVARNNDNIFFGVFKRVFDVIFAVCALIVLAIPFLVIAALVKFSSKGSVFFSGTRIGKDGKPFVFYKFRTMEVGSDDTIHREFVRRHIKQSGEKNNHEIRKITDDPRVTRIGKFLRKTSLDELPQLFNVVRGEMSLVGPRPCLPYEWEQYDDWHRRRLSAIPGCTGLWQISGRSAVGFNDMVVLDLYYIDNMSPLFDLKIIFKTIPVMLLGKGGY